MPSLMLPSFQSCARRQQIDPTCKHQIKFVWSRNKLASSKADTEESKEF